MLPRIDSKTVFDGLLDRLGLVGLAVAGLALGVALDAAGTPVEVQAWPIFRVAFGGAVAAFSVARCADIVRVLRTRPQARAALPWPGHEGRGGSGFDRAA